MDDWRERSAGDMGRAVGRGDLDPRDLCETYLSAIDASPHRDAIFARTTPDRARAEAGAAAARAKAGTRRGLTDGVPVAWKDLFDTAGVGTEAGSALLRGRVPDRDAAVLRTATQGGSVCLGKTHMSELAFSGLGLNPSTATPPHRHDAAVVPGGSSSGAAAALTHGLAPLAIGTDTGGSVRNPAAWNDLVGLKTTEGRLSLTGVVPLVESFDTIGPLARTVEDAALGLALLEGRKPADLAGATLRGARLLVLADYADSSRDAPRRAFEDAAARLAEAGADVARGTVDAVDPAMDLAAVLFTPEAYGTWRDEIEADPGAMFAPILARFRSGADFSGPDVMAAWRRLRALRADYLAATRGHDAVILPTAMLLPPDRERLLSDEDYYRTENLAALRNTRVGNLMGLCGLSLPTGTPSCGLMMLTHPGEEERLLRLAAAAEAALA